MGKPDAPKISPEKRNTISTQTRDALPPMLLVAINATKADVATSALTLGDGSLVDKLPEPIDTEAAITQILIWVSFRLEYSRTMPASATAHGQLKQVWESQKPKIVEWNGSEAEAAGPNEEWAQLFSELFTAVTYYGIAQGYRLDGIGGADSEWDEYLFSRVQSEYTLKGQRTVNGKLRGRGITSWEKLEVPKLTSVPEFVSPAIPDPAVPIACACQHLATFGLVTRGFRIEGEANEVSRAGSGTVGLSAQPAEGAPVFSSDGGSWHWKEEGNILDVSTAHQLGLLKPGTVYTYHPYHQLVSNFKASLDPGVYSVAGHPDGKMRAEILQTTGGVLTKAKADPRYNWTAPPDKTARSLPFEGQPEGSHINQVLRIHADGTRAQLFDANGGSQSKARLQQAGVGEALELLPGCNMDSISYTKIYAGSGSSGVQTFSGLGTPRPESERFQKQLAFLRMARPVGLLRLVVTRRQASPPGVDDVLFVSRLLRAYGNEAHQNYTVSRLLWSLRNTPGFSSLQPWWLVFWPCGALAKAMWAEGARQMSLADFLARHRDECKSAKGAFWKVLDDRGGLGYGRAYSLAMVLTNTDDRLHAGKVSIFQRRKYQAPPATPPADGSVPKTFLIEGAVLPPALTESLPNTKDHWHVIPEPKGEALPWDATYTNPDGARVALERASSMFLDRVVASSPREANVSSTGLDRFFNEPWPPNGAVEAADDEA